MLVATDVYCSSQSAVVIEIILIIWIFCYQIGQDNLENAVQVPSSALSMSIPMSFFSESYGSKFKTQKMFSFNDVCGIHRQTKRRTSVAIEGVSKGDR